MLAIVSGTKLELPEHRRLETVIPRIEVADKALYYGFKRILRSSEVEDVLKKVYYNLETGLTGQEMFFRRVYKDYLGVSHDMIITWLKSQRVHQIFKPARKDVVVKPFVARKPNNYWQMDLISMKAVMDQGYNYILDIIDIYSKKVWLRAVKTKTSAEIAARLEEIFKEETPYCMQSDNGGEFIGEEVQELLKKYKVKHRLGLPYTPADQGVVERKNGHVKSLIRKHFNLSNTNRWVTILPKIETNINTSVHTVTGMTPNELHEMKEGNPEVLKRITKQAKRTLEKRGDPRDLTTELKVGDAVRVSNWKARPGETARSRKINIPGPFQGELRTVTKVQKNAVKLNDDNKLYYGHQLQKVDKKGGSVISAEEYLDINNNPPEKLHPEEDEGISLKKLSPQSAKTAPNLGRITRSKVTKKLFVESSMDNKTASASRIYNAIGL
jgi:transposase InsO family protein